MQTTPTPFGLHPDDHLIDQAIRELRSTTLLRDEPVLGGHVVRAAADVTRSTSGGYRRRVDRVAEYLGGFHGLTPIGRSGTFKYNNQDHSILMGMLAAEKLLDDRATTCGVSTRITIRTRKTRFSRNSGYCRARWRR